MFTFKGACILKVVDLIAFAALNPDPRNAPILDPKDQALLLDPSSPTGLTNGEFSRGGAGVSTPLPAHVPWLRKTEYISREGSSLQHRTSNLDLCAFSYWCRIPAA